MLKSTGIINVQPHKGRMVVDVDFDFVKLYSWFINRQYWIKMNTPMHGAHITIASPKIHSGINWKKAMNHHGKKIEFEYDEYLVEGGYTKGFLMYYLRVRSEEIDKIKQQIGLVDNARYRGLHLTIANGKANTAVPHWPEGITIK